MAVGHDFCRLRVVGALALGLLWGCGQAADPCGADPAAESCPCPGAELRCEGFCIDVAADPGHCGGCDSACGTAETCTDGSCQCALGATDCGDACADLQNDIAHCGDCQTACAPNAACEDGMCVCPTGSSACPDACADLDVDGRNCGACGNACALGEACTDARCFADAGDACGGRAQNVDITRVALFQSVEALLADATAILPKDARVVDIIAGKEALVRVHVELAPRFAARELSARLSLRQGPTGQPTVLYSRQMIRNDSSQSLLSSTLNIKVPAALLQADTRYHVELVECGAPPAPSTGVTRLPAQGDAELAARTTGPIKIAFVPFLYNGILPDTSDETLRAYAREVEKQYGTTGLETKLLAALGPYSGPVDMSYLLDEVLALRQDGDPPDDDVYYYGLIKPNATFDEYCEGACTEGIAYIPEGDPDYRVGMGIAFADAESAATFAHELGHNHERDHAPCGDFEDDPDLDYPYAFQVDGTDGDVTFYSGAKIGQWGYDSLQGALKDPNNFSDLMGYCTPTWISDYTYNGITDVIAGLHKAAYRSTAAPESWDILRVTPRSSYWLASSKLETRPSKAAELVVIYDASGQELERVEGYRYRVSDGGGYRLLVPHRQPGWFAVGLPGDTPVPFP